MYTLARSARVPKTHLFIPAFRPSTITRQLGSSTKFYKEDKNLLPKQHDPKDTRHEGQFSRTDNTFSVHYPEENELPRSAPVQVGTHGNSMRSICNLSITGPRCDPFQTHACSLFA